MSFKKNEINKVNISLLITNGQGMMEKEGLLLDCFSLKKSNFFLEPSDHMLLAETFFKSTTNAITTVYIKSARFSILTLFSFTALLMNLSR